MATKTRRTGGRLELDTLWALVLTAHLRQHYAVVASPEPDSIEADLANAQTDFESTQADLVSAQTDIAALAAGITAAVRRAETRALGHAGIVDGTTDGKLQTGAAVAYSIDGQVYTKAATDDLWDLSAQTDTIAAQYRAYWLYLDADGAASIGAGSNAASEAAAIAALPAETSTKCPVGVYVAGPETDFNGAAGLAAQGTIIHGRGAALAALAALETATLDTATLETAALATTGIESVVVEDATTAGRLKLTNGAAYTIAGTYYSKGATDNLWNLSALTDLAAGQYQAIWLLLDSAGTASIGAGTVQSSAAVALRNLPVLDGTKAVIGVYVGDPTLDWDDAGGLEAQGTIHVGIPAGAQINVPGQSALLDTIELINA